MIGKDSAIYISLQSTEFVQKREKGEEGRQGGMSNLEVNISIVLASSSQQNSEVENSTYISWTIAHNQTYFGKSKKGLSALFMEIIDNS